jgi:hypothetical protein
LSANVYGVTDEHITELDLGDEIFVDANESVTVIAVSPRMRRIDVKKSDGTLDMITFDQVALGS